MKIFDTRNMPWPSDIPRNFATEPMIAYSAVDPCKVISDNNHDWKIEFSVNLVGANNTPVWKTDVEPETPFVLLSVDTSRRLYVRIRDKGELIINTRYIGVGDGLYEITVTKIGPVYVLQTWKDGTQVQNESVTKTTTATTYAYAAPRTQVGTNLEVRISDLTLNKVVWSYPTWAEDKRLLVFTNVRTDRGVFEAANTSQKWGVATQLDLRGRAPRLTVLCDCYVPPLLASGTTRDVYNLVAQGNSYQYTGAVLNFGLYLWQSEMTITFGFVNGSFQTDVTKYRLGSGYTAGRHVIVGVLDDVAGRSKLYFDGVLLASRVWSGTPTVFPGSTVYPAVTLSGSPCTNTSGTYQNKIYGAMIFDYAMTAAEIAQFK